MEQKVRQILADYGRLQADAFTIDIDDNLYRCGLSSHACVNVLLALEDAFEVEFPEQLLRKTTFESVSALQGALTGLVVALTA
jgi:acyl carrier protein